MCIDGGEQFKNRVEGNTHIMVTKEEKGLNFYIGIHLAGSGIPFIMESEYKNLDGNDFHGKPKFCTMRCIV